MRSLVDTRTDSCAARPTQGKPRKQDTGQYSQQLFAAALDALLLPISSLLPREWLVLPREAAAAAAQLALEAPPAEADAPDAAVSEACAAPHSSLAAAQLQ